VSCVTGGQTVGSQMRMTPATLSMLSTPTAAVKYVTLSIGLGTQTLLVLGCVISEEEAELYRSCLRSGR